MASIVFIKGFNSKRYDYKQFAGCYRHYPARVSIPKGTITRCFFTLKVHLVPLFQFQKVRLQGNRETVVRIITASFNSKRYDYKASKSTTRRHQKRVSIPKGTITRCSAAGGLSLLIGFQFQKVRLQVQTQIQFMKNTLSFNSKRYDYKTQRLFLSGV